MTEEWTREEEIDDPELQNKYNQTFLKCSSTSWLMTVKKEEYKFYLIEKFIKINKSIRQKTVNKKR
jgi:hypothetical protein